MIADLGDLDRSSNTDRGNLDRSHTPLHTLTAGSSSDSYVKHLVNDGLSQGYR